MFLISDLEIFLKSIVPASIITGSSFTIDIMYKKIFETDQICFHVIFGHLEHNYIKHRIITT